MKKCQCGRVFISKSSRASHRQICEAYKIVKKKRQDKYDKKAKNICPICKKKFIYVADHILIKKKTDNKHYLFYLNQEKIAIEAVKSGLSQHEIKNFILGVRCLWKMWRENFSEKEIKKIRKKNKFKIKKFICKKCKTEFYQRQSAGICRNCLLKIVIVTNGKIIRKKRICKHCKKKFKINFKSQSFCSRRCSRKHNAKLGKIAQKQNPPNWSEINREAYRNGKQVGGGTTKWLKYKKIKVQGTYELRTCKILDELKRIGKIKKWQYSVDRVPYKWKNEKHTYLIDFKVYVTNEKFYYIEVKGYESKVDKSKWKAVRKLGHKLKVWFLKDIEKQERKLSLKYSGV